MPEHLLMNRGREPKSEEIEWLSKFNSLTKNEKKELLNIICENKKRNSFTNSISKTKNGKLKNILNYYIPEESALPLLDKIIDEDNIQ
jgi:hypothetical protein